MTIVARRGARWLCGALAEDLLTVERKGDTGLVVRPAILVAPHVFQQLAAYKLELLGALRRAAAKCVSTELAPCPDCDAEFLAGGELRCPWCQAARWRSDTFSTGTRTVQDSCERVGIC